MAIEGLYLRTDKGKIYMVVDQTKDVILGNQLFGPQIIEKSLFFILLAYHNASLTWN